MHITIDFSNLPLRAYYRNKYIGNMENKYGPGSESNSPSQYFVPITWKMWLLNN